ncbi:MAG: gliding motility-associated C-terminal domain-containing protein [Bacteroidetes bacterium]|nr:gliding motility-associated C-terminal domain-containing protein [Bacteroidota bacterium]
MKIFSLLFLSLLSTSLFSQNLISNGDFEQGNISFNSDYKYGAASGNLGGPRNYRIDSVTSKWYGTWASCADHSPLGNKMMIIDADTTLNAKIWCQHINAISPNTTYKFSTYVASVINLAPGILQFSINGSLLGSPFNASATTCEWNNFYEVWNSGDATSADVCIVNQNTTWQGNDLLLDDISLIPAGLSMPNVFTPNSDGSNDTYHPFVFDEIDSYSFIIVDRWGIKVYEQKEEQSTKQPEWNGKMLGTGADCAAGTYYWVLNYGVNTLSNSGSHTLTGYLTLIK